MPLLFLLVLVSLQQILCLQINKNNVVEKYFVKIKNLGIIIVVLRHFIFNYNNTGWYNRLSNIEWLLFILIRYEMWRNMLVLNLVTTNNYKCFQMYFGNIKPKSFFIEIWFSYQYIKIEIIIVLQWHGPFGSFCLNMS